MRAPKPAFRSGPLDGAIVTIKDLFDVAGEVTRAGSKVLADGRQAGASVTRPSCAACAKPARSSSPRPI